MNKAQYDQLSRLLSISLKLVGVLGIVFIVIFWAATDRVVLAFLPFFGTMAGIGQGLDVVREIAQDRGREATSG